MDTSHTIHKQINQGRQQLYYKRRELVHTVFWEYQFTGQSKWCDRVLVHQRCQGTCKQNNAQIS